MASQPACPGERGADLAVGHGHLAVVELDQVAQRLDPDRVCPPEGHLVEQALAGDAEQIAHRDVHAVLGQHCVHLGLEPRAQHHELAR